MIYIDNRVLIPILAPFLGLFAIWLLDRWAGAAWDATAIEAAMSPLVGWGVGSTVAILLFVKHKTIGGFWIGSKKQ